MTNDLNFVFLENLKCDIEFKFSDCSKISIYGEYAGAIIDGKEITKLNTIEWLDTKAFTKERAIVLAKNTVGDCLFLVESYTNKTIITSPAFSGIYYKKHNSNILLSKNERKLFDAKREKLDNQETIRFIVDNINLSPTRTFFCDIGRIPAGSIFESFGHSFEISSYLLHGYNRPQEFNSIESFERTIDRVAKLLSEHYKHSKFIIPISGGVDGIVWLCAMAKTKVPIIAICGEKRGDSEELMCETIVKRLKGLGFDNIDYFSVSPNCYSPAKKNEITKRKLRFLIKSNYIQRDYKLKLVDLKALEKVDPTKAIFINGYGIDEMYMGTKNASNYSSVYKTTIIKKIGLLINHYSFLDFSIRLDWLIYKIYNICHNGSNYSNIRKALRKRIFKGKVGPGKRIWIKKTRVLYDRQVYRQLEDCMSLLGVNKHKELNYTEFYNLIRSFMFYHVEVCHLIRFANHAKALNSQYLLPYESGPIRDYFHQMHLTIHDALNPKQKLFDYVNRCLGDNFFQSIQMSDKRNTFYGFIKTVLHKMGSELFSIIKMLFVFLGGNCRRESNNIDNLFNYYSDAAENKKSWRIHYTKELSDYFESLDKSLKENTIGLTKKITYREYENYIHFLYYISYLYE